MAKLSHFFASLIFLIFLITGVLSVFRGNRLSVRKVPFLVFGIGTFKGVPKQRFGAAVLNKDLVLTTSFASEK